MKKIAATFTTFLLLFLSVVSSPVLAQDEMTPVQPAIFGNGQAPKPVKDAGTEKDFSTRTTAIECAVSQIAESAGEQHRALDNRLTIAFQSGECAGKMQTYMLAAESQNPDCFPKISLEEGIAIFVKWADAHPDELSQNYILGFKAAFTDAVPCMKK